MKDYLIVGLGLSGINLAFRLEQAGRTFVVYDDHSSQASKVAGGLMNPIILKRFTLAWKADRQLSEALSVYRSLEKKFGKDFLKPLPIYRKFASVAEQNDWFGAADKPLLSPFLDVELTAEVNPGIQGDYLFGKVLHTHRLETPKLLESYESYLLQKGQMIPEKFEYSELQVNNKYVEYRGAKARNIIFCEGSGMRHNPFFQYLPLRGNKGEYLVVRAPELKLKVAVKSSIFIFPLGHDTYAVGATYNNQDQNPEPTLEAKEELVRKLTTLISVDYEVIDQVAGIRPSSVDRRPIVGRHPAYPNLYCCNGFGSRGILLGPTISAQLVNFIERDAALPPEVSVDRFTRKWYPGT